jgi:hypothetical protein
VRSLATSAGGRHDAIVLRMGSASQDFAAYDSALVSLTAIHQKAFTSAISEGDDALSGWNLVLPVAAIVIALLVLAGVRPRLSEFR